MYTLQSFLVRWKKFAAAMTVVLMVAPFGASAAQVLCTITDKNVNANWTACFLSTENCYADRHCTEANKGTGPNDYPNCRKNITCNCKADPSCDAGRDTTTNPVGASNCSTFWCEWDDNVPSHHAECFTTAADCKVKAGKDCACAAPNQKALNDAAKAAAAANAPAKPTKLDDPLGNIGIRLLAGRVTNMFMGLSGTFALVAFIMGGFKMITANGNDKKYAEGLSSLKWAIIGLAVIFGAYAILNSLFSALGGAAG